MELILCLVNNYMLQKQIGQKLIKYYEKKLKLSNVLVVFSQKFLIYSKSSCKADPFSRICYVSAN